MGGPMLSPIVDLLVSRRTSARRALGARSPRWPCDIRGTCSCRGAIGRWRSGCLWLASRLRRQSAAVADAVAVAAAVALAAAAAAAPAGTGLVPAEWAAGPAAAASMTSMLAGLRGMVAAVGRARVAAPRALAEVPQARARLAGEFLAEPLSASTLLRSELQRGRRQLPRNQRRRLFRKCLRRCLRKCLPRRMRRRLRSLLLQRPRPRLPRSLPLLQWHRSRLLPRLLRSPLRRLLRKLLRQLMRRLSGPPTASSFLPHARRRELPRRRTPRGFEMPESVFWRGPLL